MRAPGMNMFGHLSAEDFVNLIDGVDLPPKRRAHIDSCARCHATWRSMQSMHIGVSSMDGEIPEPDWGQFRLSVRDQLLSRSIQRSTAVRRWTGWAFRPVTGWALSAVLVAGITTTVMWKAGQETPSPASVVEPATDSTNDVIEVGPERALFDDVVSLEDEQQEKLLELLQAAQKGSTNPQ